MIDGQPTISIIVPVHNAASFLGACLASLFNTSIRPFEVIVVDDASTDGSRDIAREFATRVICLDERAGPARARNIGAAVARGEYLLFLDADVRVHPESVDRLVNVLVEESDLCAVFGSYDDQPTSPGVVSQFRNLLHRDIHQTSHQDAASFWAGFGAICCDAFAQFRGFDEEYGRPSIEDIELGQRIHGAGGRIALAKEACVTHLKSWSLGSMIRCDFMSRGIPWTRLILQKRCLPNDLNLKHVHRASVAAVYLSLLALFAAGTSGGWLWLAWGVQGLLLLAADRWTTRGGNWTVFAVGTALVGVAAAWLGWRLGGFVALSVGLVGAAMALNSSFYGRLVHCRGLAFALIAAPLHLIHYTVCGAAFVAGIALHAWAAMDKALTPARDGSEAPAREAAGSIIRGATAPPARAELQDEAVS